MVHEGSGHLETWKQQESAERIRKRDTIAWQPRTSRRRSARSDENRDQWRFVTSLIGGEMRDNCVDEIFYNRPYKCEVLPHLAQPSFASCDPTIYFCSH